jgi:hypothetical protein
MINSKTPSSNFELGVLLVLVEVRVDGGTTDRLGKVVNYWYI